jgi:hypothetical protein
MKIKEKYVETKSNLNHERKKTVELEKKLKKIKFKEENFDHMETNFLLLEKEYKKLVKKYEQSELIRKEQGKIIKSMQYEIELLKEGK